MTDGAKEVAEHLRDCAQVDAAVVMQSGSADDVIEQLLSEGWTWDQTRQTEVVAGKRIRYLRSPGDVEVIKADE